MGIGPCLCGDPYCPSCGNPEQAAFEDAVEAMFEKIMEEKIIQDYQEIEIFYEAGKKAVELFRNHMEEKISEIRNTDGDYIQYLEEKIEWLKQQKGEEE